MKTFYEFLESKKTDEVICNLAKAIVENNVDYERYMYQVFLPSLGDWCAEQGFVLEEGFWGNLGQGISSMWKGLSGGAKMGWAAAKDAVAGQKAYYDGVVTNLKKLINVLPTAATTTGQDVNQAMKMVNWLKSMLSGFEAQKSQFQTGQVQRTVDSATGRQQMGWQTNVSQPGDVDSSGRFTPQPGRGVSEPAAGGTVNVPYTPA